MINSLLEFADEILRFHSLALDRIVLKLAILASMVGIEGNMGFHLSPHLPDIRHPQASVSGGELRAQLTPSLRES